MDAAEVVEPIRSMRNLLKAFSRKMTHRSSDRSTGAHQRQLALKPNCGYRGIEQGDNAIGLGAVVRGTMGERLQNSVNEELVVFRTAMYDPSS